jgi:hypothetical protein
VAQGPVATSPYELISPWFSDAERIAETCIFVEPGHRRSVGARELRKITAWWRKESDKRQPDAAPAVANSLSVVQNGAAAATPKSVPLASSEQTAFCHADPEGGRRNCF